MRNDLFVAHEAVYKFATTWVEGRDVLDAACGTGYGSAILFEGRARSVLGVDISGRRVRYARRKFARPGVRFSEMDLGRLVLPDDSRQVIVSSNTLEHVANPRLFLDAARRVLSGDGVLIVAVPPILSAADVVAHGVNDFHVSNLSVRAWADLFREARWEARYFSQRSSVRMDFSSLDASRLRYQDFCFNEESIEAAYGSAPICSLFVLSPGPPF